MTDALVQINDRLARAAREGGLVMATFHCECGECLAADVPLSLDEQDEIRAREDLIFAPGHDAPRSYRAMPTQPEVVQYEASEWELNRGRPFGLT